MKTIDVHSLDDMIEYLSFKKEEFVTEKKWMFLEKTNYTHPSRLLKIEELKQVLDAFVQLIQHPVSMSMSHSLRHSMFKTNVEIHRFQKNENEYLLNEGMFCLKSMDEFGMHIKNPLLVRTEQTLLLQFENETAEGLREEITFTIQPRKR